MPWNLHLAADYLKDWVARNQAHDPGSRLKLKYIFESSRCRQEALAGLPEGWKDFAVGMPRAVVVSEVELPKIGGGVLQAFSAGLWLGTWVVCH